MRESLINKSDLPASARITSPAISLVRARTVSVTFRVTFPASGAGNCTGEVFYSADGLNFDTIPFGTVTITLTAGAAVQLTAVVVPPEHGQLKFAVLNSNANPVTDVRAWYSVQSWEATDKTPAVGTLERNYGDL